MKLARSPSEKHIHHNFSFIMPPISQYYLTKYQIFYRTNYEVTISPYLSFRSYPHYTSLYYTSLYKVTLIFLFFFQKKKKKRSSFPYITRHFLLYNKNKNKQKKKYRKNKRHPLRHQIQFKIFGGLFGNCLQLWTPRRMFLVPLARDKPWCNLNPTLHPAAPDHSLSHLEIENKDFN